MTTAQCSPGAATQWRYQKMHQKGLLFWRFQPLTRMRVQQSGGLLSEPRIQRHVHCGPTHRSHYYSSSPRPRKVASYSFKVYAMDSSASNPRNTSAEVTVHILDVNDNAPYFITDPLIINVSSSSFSNHKVLATMRAEDKTSVQMDLYFIGLRILSKASP